MVSNAQPFKWEIANRVDFQRALKRLGEVTNDFRIPFRLIASDYYRSQKKLFKLAGPGLYNPLGGFDYSADSGYGTQSKRRRAEDQKERLTGHAAYPLLYGVTGDLRDSSSSLGHTYSHFLLSKITLEMGTTVPYGIFHQSDKIPRKKLPQRKFIFIDGGPADKSSDSSISGRRERWFNILNDHVLQLLKGEVL